MNTLLIIFALGVLPVLPEPPRKLSLVAPSQEIILRWVNYPVGCSNIVWYGESPDSLTNQFYTGQTNALPVAVPLTRTYFKVEPLFGGYDSRRSDVIQFPPETFWQVLFKTWHGDTLTITPIITFSGTPPGDRGLLVWTNWQDYNP